MKNKHVLSLAAMAVCAALSTPVLAQHHIDFEGVIVDSACTGAVAGTGGLVTLPQVDAAALPSDGSTAGETTFEVELAGCAPSPSNYQVNFSQSTAESGRLKNTGTASGVSLQLLSSNDSELTVTNSASVARVDSAIDPGINVDLGSGKGQYKVRYYRDGAITGGDVKARATMTLNWQ